MDYPAKGIDKSHWNLTGNLSQFMAEGFSFFIFKTADGETYTDEQWATNEAEAISLGAPYGGYLYYRVAHDNRAQARLFYNNAKLAPIIPGVDVERENNVNLASQSKFSYQLQDCVEYIAELFQREPMIYTSWGAWEQLIGSYGSWASKYKLWVANYEVEQPKLPAPWTEWLLWQWTKSYKLPGSTKLYDANYLNVGYTIEDLVTHTPTLEERVALLEQQMLSVIKVNNRQARRLKALEDALL